MVETHGSENNSSSDPVGVGAELSNVNTVIVFGIGICCDADLAHDFDNITGLKKGVTFRGFGIKENTNGFSRGDPENSCSGQNRDSSDDGAKVRLATTILLDDEVSLTLVETEKDVQFEDPRGLG